MRDGRAPDCRAELRIQRREPSGEFTLAFTDRPETEGQSPVGLEIGLHLAQAHAVGAVEQTDLTDQARPHLPARHPVGQFGHMPLATPATAPGVLLVFGDRVAHLGQVEDLVAQGRFRVRFDHAAAGTMPVRVVALGVIDLIDHHPRLTRMAGLRTAPTPAAWLLAPRGARLGIIARRRLGGIAGTQPHLLFQLLDAQRLSLNLLVQPLDLLPLAHHHLPQLINQPLGLLQVGDSRWRVAEVEGAHAFNL